MDHDNTTYEVNNSDGSNKVTMVIKEKKKLNMRSIKRGAKLITQILEKEDSTLTTPKRDTRKRLNSESPIPIIEFNGYMDKDKRKKLENKNGSKSKRKIKVEVNKMLVASAKKKEKSKYTKRLNSESPMQPLLRKDVRKKRAKQEDINTPKSEDKENVTNILDTPSTPVLHDFEDVSDYASDLDN